MFGRPHPFGQDDAEAVEKRGLGGVGLSDAAQANLTVGGGRQDHVMRLDARQLFDDRRGEFPRPARCCHISRLFHSTKARKQTRI
jgi:hypothetical protein